MNKQNSFLSPRFWPTWMGIACLRLMALLPFSAGLALGRLIGTCLYHLIPKRRKVVQVNVGLCFPELNDQEKQEFVKDVFRNSGIGLVEIAWAYWGDAQKLADRTDYVDLELIEEALSQGKGLVLLGAHYSSLDLGGALLAQRIENITSMYRKHNNPLMDEVIVKGRSGFCIPVERKKIREVIRYLRQNKIAWYGPDQDLGKKNSVFVPFFNHTAATVTGTTNMVNFNKSPILCMHQRRKEDDSGYIIEIIPMEGFPSGNEVEDARLMNQALEAGIRKAPTQYMWTHKRFKTQPDGNQKLYKQAGC